MVDEPPAQPMELTLQNHALLSKCEKLEQRLASYIDLYDFAPIGYFTLDDHGIIQQTNLTGAKLLGQERVHLRGQPFGFFVSEAARATFEAFLSQVLAGISKGICEVMLAPDDAPYRHAHLEGLGLAANGERWCHVAVMDITAQKMAEEALRDTETFNTTVLDSLTEQVVVIDTQGVITKVNAAWRQSAEENGAPELAQHSVGWSYRDVCLAAAEQPGKEAAVAWAGIEAILTGKKDHFIQEYPCNSPGESRWFRMQVYPLVAPRRGAVITHANITEQKLNEEWLKLSEARYSAVIEEQTDLISRFLPDGTLTFVNDAYCRYFGRPREEFLAANLMLVVPEESQALVAEVLTHCNADHPFYMLENQVVRADGEVRWVQWSNQAILDENQALLELQSVGRDVTERKRVEAALRASEIRFRQLFTSMDTGCALHEMIVDDQNQPLDYRFLNVNPAFEKITGLNAAVLIGQTVRNALPNLEPDWIEIFGQVALTGEPTHFQKIAQALGKIFEVIAYSPQKGQFACLLSDITERKRMEAALQEMATTDDLTGLANRRHFMARLDEECARLQRRDAAHAALLMLDLDHFKMINDTQGHATGDAALRHFATLLQAELRKIDIAGRIGGEEFAILLPGADPADARIFAERLRKKVAASPLLQESQSILVTVSIGISALDVTDSRADVALIRADQALYRAKAQGRNQVIVGDR